MNFSSINRTGANPAVSGTFAGKNWRYPFAHPIKWKVNKSEFTLNQLKDLLMTEGYLWDKVALVHMWDRTETLAARLSANRAEKTGFDQIKQLHVAERIKSDTSSTYTEAAIFSRATRENLLRERRDVLIHLNKDLLKTFQNVVRNTEKNFLGEMLHRSMRPQRPLQALIDYSRHRQILMAAFSSLAKEHGIQLTESEEERMREAGLADEESVAFCIYSISANNLESLEAERAHLDVGINEAHILVDLMTEIRIKLLPTNMFNCVLKFSAHKLQERVCAVSKIIPTRMNIPGAEVRDIDLVQPVGEGAFATVYKAKYKNQTVVMKYPKAGTIATWESKTPEDPVSISTIQEAILWYGLKHPHVNELLGIVMDASLSSPRLSSRPALILAYVPHQALKYVQTHPEGLDPLKLSFEIAQGLQYIHSLGVVHGDIKLDNVLIDDEGHAQIMDFGLSVTSIESFRSSVKGPNKDSGAFPWRAPELLLHLPVTKLALARDDSKSSKSKLAQQPVRPEDYDVDYASIPRPTEQSDVWSWACTVIEAHTKQAPFYDALKRRVVSDTDIVTRVVVDEKHVARPKGDLVPDELWDLLCKCWTYAPDERSTMQLVVQELTTTFSLTPTPIPNDDTSTPAPR